VLLVFALFALGSLAARTAVAQDIGEPRSDGPPAAATATRLIPLYYVRDAEKVIATVRGPVESPSRSPASPRTERLQSLAEERRRLQAQQAALMTPQAPPAQPASPGRILEVTGFFPTPPLSIEQDLAKIERELALLDRQEQALRAEDFRNQAQSAGSGGAVASEARESPSAADQVRITVLGEGQLHLRGPLEGVNAIARMVHEIDQPVGQVKLGIHVVQFTAQDDAAFDGVPGLVDRYLAHARQMSQTSQSLFRAAMSAVAARYYSLDPNGFEEAFFYGACVRNFRSLNGAQATVSVSLLDSRDIVTTLYLTGLATNDARHEILAEFQRLVAAELPRLHEQYQQAIAAAQGRPAKSPSLLARVTGTGAPAEADSQPAPRLPDLSFSRTLSYLEPYGGQPNSVHPIQVATARFQRALLELRQAEAAVAAMRNDRLVLAFTSSHRPPSARFQTAAGDVLDAASLGSLADRVIEEQTARVLDLREVTRAEVAALDGQLNRLTTAFEEDLRRQFYQPVLEDVRRNSGIRKLRMGQVQTTTIRTNDRTLARVSPGQVAVLDRPVRPVLAQEGLQVAHGLVQEAQSLAQYGSLQAAGNLAVPGGSSLLAQAGLVPVPGQHLGQLVGASERITVSAGDDIAVTPVIQPDGFSVAFHLVYTHTPQRESDGQTPPPAGVQRHMIEADVHMPSLESQEVSRFRVALDSEEQGKGVPLLEDVPGVGALFRPRRAAASTTQENIILVEAVVYPTALALAGKCWLAIDSADPRNPSVPNVGCAAAPGGRSELEGWVLQTLRRQAQSHFFEPDNASRIAQPAGGSVSGTAPRTVSR
jgi:hypothetical protein